MNLIIAEKSSLAKTIACALGKYENHKDKEDRTGYYKNDEYIITWAFGHILELYSIYNYFNVDKMPWEDIPLPYVPKEFLYKLKNSDAIKKQFNILKDFINSNDIDTIIHCGDADREGQLIVDNILSQIKTTKDIKRLWLPEQTDETIRYSLKNLKDNKEYTNLHNEGIARARLDWLFGINLSVFLKNKTGIRLNVGRVMIPMVKYIYDRDMEIKNFKSKKYYQVEGILEKDNLKITLTDERKEDTKEKSVEIANKLTGKVKVAEIEKKEVIKQASKLFSLDTLQSFLSKNYKLEFGKSLEIIQSLYEQGYITYPRTNTEYLADTEKEKVKELIKVLDVNDELDFIDLKKIFDSTKVESHSAIIPTKKIPNNLQDNEKLIYEVIKNRFIANFLKEKTVTEKTTITIQSLTDENIIFKLVGETIIQEGFYKYEPKDFKNELPNFNKNDEFEVIFESKEKMTSSPKKITEEDLGNFLKNPFKKELKESDDDEYKSMLEGIEIGTVATRTPTIEKLKEYGYISQKKSTYSIEPLGENLIEVLNKLNINLYAERTVIFGKLLKQVYKNEKNIEDVIKTAYEELDNIIKQDIEIEKINKDDNLESLGTCPMCGKGQIHQKKSKEGKIYYSCSEKDCKFFLWEQAKHFNNPIKVTKSKLKNLLNNKKEAFKLKNKEGKEYEAYLKIKINGTFVNFEMDGFKNTTNKK